MKCIIEQLESIAQEKTVGQDYIITFDDYILSKYSIK